MTKNSTKKGILIIGLVIGFALLLRRSLFPNDQQNKKKPNYPTPSAGYAAIDQTNFPFAFTNYIKAQFLHETSGGTSGVYRRLNNMFGYNYSQYGANTFGATPDPDSIKPIYSRYADYKNVKDSTNELAAYLRRRITESIDNNSNARESSGSMPSISSMQGSIAYNNFVNNANNNWTLADYVRFLKGFGYFTDSYSNYLRGCTFYLQKIQISEGIVTGGANQQDPGRKGTTTNGGAGGGATGKGYEERV